MQGLQQAALRFRNRRILHRVLKETGKDMIIMFTNKMRGKKI